ncbi:MAG TPA: NAD(P)-binding domain-containing protein [Bacteroidia bacterium]|nr:NAD(P)-binding domain-containing protein [Bacteroidia bacterium]
MKKIGIIGSGAVGKALGNGFIKHGYQVMIGTRDTSKLSDWKIKAGDNAGVGSVHDAAQFGDIIVLAVKGMVAEEAVKENIIHLAGKTVIDTTNPISDEPPVNGVLKFFTDINHSLMERLQNAAPAANFVKAFNIVGNTLMVNPKLPGGKPTMFICGNNDNAKKEVSEILDQFGWEIADMGKAEAARAIEPLCILWCITGFLENDWMHAYKLMKM